MGHTRFVWFWTFWHWSREGFRTEVLLHGPLGDIVGNWDEWFQHEAPIEDREAIASVGDNEGAQREFVHWLVTTWATGADLQGNRSVATFVLRRLAGVAPFDGWSAMAEYRTADASPRISAVVLAEESQGRESDVRSVDAIVLPGALGTGGGTIAAEGFQADVSELNAARLAAMSLLRGAGQLRLLATWIVAGGRSYSLGWHIGLGAGWCIVGGLIVRLLFGPDPGAQLPFLGSALVGLWLVLALASLVRVGMQVRTACRVGRVLSSHLERDDVRMKMEGNLALKGGSAGLPFCLAIVVALGRAYPAELAGSWIWRRLLVRLEAVLGRCAATGVITADGEVKPVLVEAKLRACVAHARVARLLVPCQPGANQRAVDLLERAKPEEAAPPAPLGEAVGHAADAETLRVHRCRHVAGALLQLGAMRSPWQPFATAFAVLISGVMLAALPDLSCMLFPPAPPIPVAPVSPSPYFLWVSVTTRHPDFFQVVLQSPSWAYRRAEIAARNSAPASVRAEIRLVRMRELDTRDLEQGAVFIERRPRFLTRKYKPTEQVGQYSLAYIARLGRE